jgi:ribosome recycling factor
MKKRLLLLVSLMGLAWLAASGCSNKNIDTAKVRAAFPSLSGDARQNLDQGLKAIDESNYVAAVRPLKTLAYKVKLDKSQTDILEDTINKAEALAAKQK